MQPAFRYTHLNTPIHRLHPLVKLAYLLLTLTVLFWSGNWVVGRWIRGDVPPIALSFWRWVIAFLCLLPWAGCRRSAARASASAAASAPVPGEVGRFALAPALKK